MTYDIILFCLFAAVYFLVRFNQSPCLCCTKWSIVARRVSFCCIYWWCLLLHYSVNVIR